jgi:3-hydroxyacyl-CoA dehydrogenase
MEQNQNPAAAEASTDERAFFSFPGPGPCTEPAARAAAAEVPPRDPGDALDFDPVPLRYRSDGWTPERQRDYVEALADCGIARRAAALVGMSEQSVSRLRRRPEARAFDLACEAAARIGARRVLSTAFERALEGTIKRHYYHGELKSEERVYDNRLLTYLIGKLGPALEPREQSRSVEENWTCWMDAIEQGAPPPGPMADDSEYLRHHKPVWEGEDDMLWTDFPPPAGFCGREIGRYDGLHSYRRTLTPAELAALDSEDELIRVEERARRDRYFGFAGGIFSPREAEPYEPSADRGPPAAPETGVIDGRGRSGLSRQEPSIPESEEMSPITTRKHGDVLIVTSNNPPVNALGAAVREGLVKAIEEADGDDAVKAVVIICQGQTFFAGADITEFGKPMQLPMLPTVVDIIENCTKPVVAAIHGTAFGGGLEVALASHYRVAVPSAKLGVPEVKLGLLPGAGGTQRLPRVAGVAKALEMAATGNPIGAKEAYEIGLVDRLIEGDLEQHACAFAEEVREVRPIPKSSERDEKLAEARANPAIFDEFRKANARKFKGFDAPESNVKAIEAAVAKPYAEGVLDERRLFMELMTGTQARAQQYFFFAERKAAKIDGLPEDTKPRDIRRVGVIGAGTMGGGISMNFLSAGVPVTIVEMEQAALDRGTGVMRKNYEATAAKGRMTADQVEAAMGALKPTLALEDLADCDLIIEAVFENMDVKKEIFGKLDKIAKAGAILASNTSYLNIDEIAASTSRPQDVLGLHFFSPANVMKLLEVVRGAKTAPDVLVTAMQLAKRIKKVAVVAGVCHGFIGNRMLMPRQVEAMKLLLEGATPQQIDKVHVEFGMPMGPFQMSDLAGVDIGWHRDPTRIENIRDALAAEGRWGQKKGAGFYDYDEKRTPSPSPRVAEIIEDFRNKTNTPQHEIADQEIVERTLYSMVNEGAKILEEGMAQRASDIDVVWVYGYGWPVYRGGPMFWAGSEGLARIVAGLEKHGFEISALLREKAEKGERF